MNLEKFILKEIDQLPESGKNTWEAPSNIALVKYWGKYGEQLPKNTSISFTLKNCKTITQLSYKKKENRDGFSVKVIFDGKENEDFKPKIIKFFERIETYLPFLKSYDFVIDTQNTFPHSSGIASSASGMAALSLCLMDMEKKINPNTSQEHFYEKASFLARLGSGSAARSVKGNLVVWGEHPKIENSNNYTGIAYPYEVHKNFQNYQDTILIVEKGKKEVSSSVGHDLMHHHAFAEQRFLQAQDNISKMISILKQGNLDDFINLVESEALTLHAMMMTSNPYYILMKPNTLKIINKIWQYRKETGSKVCFTLDAGANVHVLFPEKEKSKILEFIKSQLVDYCEKGMYICDNVGFGDEKINH
ncbi:diphosphomevalonate/mevalonate 3,5-bisphosphate decarboxylase family protein [Mesonia sp. K7]|uniref:diphosphomevalonate/mevalonate 3,5-bisphosphate decarboxylase family protein n=1 Tax=Mesonia sp. K7 TaxID=2218606 RepID=UPI000DA93215|nr:diphosphomevalonate decarboxylase [Mesonia sp. K7]PZD79611.1 diphosphomevalonate decarboxylase [Mesonia sp. K7]